MKKISLFLILTVVVALLMTGCITAPRPLEPGAEKVHVDGDNSLMNCKFLGQIKGEDIHGDVFPPATKQNLALDDINYLKNEGKKLGANVVAFTQHQVMTTERTVTMHKQGSRTYNVITHNIQGSAYNCPTAMMGAFKKMKSRELPKKQGSLIIQDHTVEKSGMLVW